MIAEGSRYENSVVLMAESADGVFRPTVYYQGWTVPQHIAFRYRTVREGDRFDTIATDVFGQPSLWWMIAYLNPEVLNPLDLTEGLVIRVPVR